MLFGQRSEAAMRSVSRVLFSVAAVLLAVLAALLVAYAGFQVIRALFNTPAVLLSGDFGYIVIDAVGYVVIAIAILDVTKHLVEQEVLGEESPGKGGFRDGLYKFVSIISIAIFLEGLVIVFKMTQDDVRLLLYPVLLLLVGVAMMVGLALSRWLASR